jgi:hypothetical protein
LNSARWRRERVSAVTQIVRATSLIALLILAGCGGGGGGSGTPVPSPAPVPTPAAAPSIATQPAAVTVADGTMAQFTITAVGDAAPCLSMAPQWD